MYLLLSGEGPSDMGHCASPANLCEGDDFQPGPMGLIVDQLVESELKYSLLDFHAVGFISETNLAKVPLDLMKKAPALPGKKRPPETQYFFRNARALAIAARKYSAKREGEVVAVLFRDADGTASAGRGNWTNKHKSMLNGFKQEDYSKLGVPMIPNPKSEAWLLCAVKADPFQVCNKLEEASGNDDSANPLKKQLSDALKGHDSTTELNEMLTDQRIDLEKIDMESFNVFKIELSRAVDCATRQNP